MRAFVVATVVVFAAGALAASGYKPGWSETAITEATASCTEGLVKGAWENTKREQGVDPKMEMTPEIRKQLAPQIEGMTSLCGCAIRQAARKYEPQAAHDADFERFVVGLVKTGRCTLPK